MSTTLAQAKASSIPQAVGINACDDRFVTLLNEAQSRLADMGRWWGTWRRMRLCAVAGCITWPTEVRTIEGLNMCGYDIPIRNQWFEFQTNVRAPSINCGYVCEQPQLLDRGTVVQYRDFTTPSYIRLYPTSSTDVGKKILIQGLDANGIPIRTLDSGVWVDGEYLTLASPFVTSSNLFKNPGMTGVQKPLTNNRITVVSVSPIDASETDIAVWAPYDLNPSYRRTYLKNLARICNSNPNNNGCGDCRDKGDGCLPADLECSNIVLEAIVRLGLVPALADTDWLFIQNLDALKHMMKCIQKEDKNQYQESERETQLALRALRNELEVFDPPTRTSVNALSQGTAYPRRIFGGFL